MQETCGVPLRDTLHGATKTASTSNSARRTNSIMSQIMFKSSFHHGRPDPREVSRHNPGLTAGFSRHIWDVRSGPGGLQNANFLMWTKRSGYGTLFWTRWIRSKTPAN